MKLLSNLFIPFVVIIVIIYGTYKKTNVYDTFIEGSKDALPMILNMFPPLLAMIFGINIILNVFGITIETVPFSTREIGG